MTKTINFNDLGRGTVVDNEYSAQGVTVSATGGAGEAMIFDTANPTGGDHDLETNNLGNVLIISEDGDSHDPDDNAQGGTFRFDFHEAADVKSLTFLDIEESATVRFYDAHGALIATCEINPTGNNGQRVEHFDVEGAVRMDVTLCGSGAIDNLVFDDTASNLDGIVDGTSGDDLIDVNYTGDPDGDRVDANDQILAGEGPDDDIIVALGGDDVIRAGNGNDEVFGGSGDDSIDGGSGDDYIEGNGGDDIIKGGAGNDVLIGDGDNAPAESTEFNIDWDQLGSDGHQTLTVDGQSVNVSIATPQNAEGKQWFVENGMLKNWDVTHPSTADMHFDTEISNVKFTLLDVDALDKITIMAKDAHGNLVDVSFENTGVHTVNGNMVVGSETNHDGPGATNNGQDIDVTIDGPIKHLWIVLDNGPERHFSGTVAVSDIAFEIPAGDTGEDGNDTIHGGAGDDVIMGNGGDDVVTGDAGNDDIDGGAGDDMLFGGAGDDEIDGGSGNDKIEASAGDDVIDGGEGDDDIWGGRGDDVIVTGAGNDNVNAGNDADVIFGSAGDTIDGGAGGNDHDTLDLSGKGPFYLDNVTTDSNGNGINGTVVFVDADGVATGDTIHFVEIEKVVGEQVNRDPDAVDDMAHTDEDTPVTITVLGNDTDPDGDDLTIISAVSPNGTVVINDDGTLTFTPNENFNGMTTVDYVVSDGNGGTDKAWVKVTVDPVNDAPDAVDDTSTTDEDTSVIVDLLANDTDVDGDTLMVTNVSVPAEQGTVVDNGDGTATFTPAADFTGTAMISYDIKDGNGGRDWAKHFVEVEAVNDGPVATDDADSTDQDTAIDLVNVLGNDTDAESDALTVTDVDGVSGNVGGAVAGSNGGLITINADGTASFDPNGEFEGLADGETAETSVTYTISDGNGGTDTATVTVTVTGTNDGPTAVADVDATDAETSIVLDNVLGNDSDPDGDALTVTNVDGAPGNVGGAVAGSNGGLITINADGTASFDPNGEFEGLADGETAETSVTYTISDGNGGTDTATVTVTVTGTNDGPTAVADVDATDAETSIVLDNVLGNDSDPDGDALTVTNVDGAPGNVGGAVAGSNGGLITINADGSASFDPNGEFDDLINGETAETSVTYTVSDGNGGEASTTVTVTVTGTNSAPTATNNSYVFVPTEAAGDVDGNVLTDDTGNGADSDPEGDALTVVAVSGAAGGVGTAVAGDNGGLFTINADGSVDFDANGEFDNLGLGDSAETSVTYTISDGNGGTDTATVTFAVEGVNDGTVQGTNGDDVIIPGYVDADGDIVDAGDNILPGKGPNDDVILAGPGNDSVLAGVGDDTVFGGLGNDDIDGGAGDDLLLGGEGDDTVAGGDGDDRIFGAEGDDTLEGGAGNDVIEGSEGEDSIQGGDGDDDIWGGLDDDIVRGGDGNDTVGGGAGNDDVRGGDGDDLLFGGTGDDSITGGEGSDNVEGGDGDDVINTGNHNDPAPDVGYPTQPSATIPGLVFPGYDADDDPDNDKDTVDGGAGNDVISTGDDDDSIIGGSGDDTIDAGFDDDTVDGGTGNDVIEGNEGNDVIDGGDGDDVIYGGLADPLADLVSFPDDEPNEFGFQDLVPENNGDTIFGGAGNDIIFGQDDDDTLFGGSGDDTLDGGVDDDVLEGGDGDDTLLGGQGADDLDGGAGDDELDGGTGDDVIAGGDGDDVITGGEGVDEQSGGFGSDTFLGGNGGDNVVGGEDPDDSDIDVLDLTGSNVDFITYTDGDPESGVVTFLDGSTMTFSEIENVIPCFTPGTTIATPKGERLVEELTVGDRIITRDNGIQEIAWVGHKSMDGKQLAVNPHLKPILIKAGSLGDGLPERDMLVSPNHRVLVASEMTQLYFEEREVLAAAKHMTGAQGIHAVDVMATTYIHFMFEKHEVVLSNGAWTESFQPGDYSLKGIGNSQRNEIFELFPELATKGGLEDYQSARKALKKHEAKLLMK